MPDVKNEEEKLREEQNLKDKETRPLTQLFVELTNITEKLNLLLQRKQIQTQFVDPIIERPQQPYTTATPPRHLFPAVCSICNCQTSVPFKPRPGADVKCIDCYKKARGY